MASPVCAAASGSGLCRAVCWGLAADRGLAGPHGLQTQAGFPCGAVGCVASEHLIGAAGLLWPLAFSRSSVDPFYFQGARHRLCTWPLPGGSLPLQ